MDGKFIKRLISCLTLVAFLTSSTPGVGQVYAQTQVLLPAPGSMVSFSRPFTPALLKGIKVYSDNPFRFDFILDKGNWGEATVIGQPASLDSQRLTDDLKIESTRLIKYFMAALTVPEKDLWVNLSPYEKDRIVPEAFGLTEMGRDLLAQDYLLKQITASAIYPEGDTGRRFWNQVYTRAQEKYGTTDIPVDTFNKVWIVPEKAVVYEKTSSTPGAGAVGYIIESRLKVMLESDYVALENAVIKADGVVRGSGHQESQELAKDVIREIVLPELEKEVNEGANFSALRQVYQSLILAAWFKSKIKESVLSQVYVDRNKVAGVNIDDPKEAEKIWGQYVDAFKKGAYNYIKEESEAVTGEVIPRKYFSGGLEMAMSNGRLQTTDRPTPAMMSGIRNSALSVLSVILSRPGKKISDLSTITWRDQVLPEQGPVRQWVVSIHAFESEYLKAIRDPKATPRVKIRAAKAWEKAVRMLELWSKGTLLSNAVSEYREGWQQQITLIQSALQMAASLDLGLEKIDSNKDGTAVEKRIDKMIGDSKDLGELLNAVDEGLKKMEEKHGLLDQERLQQLRQAREYYRRLQTLLDKHLRSTEALTRYKLEAAENLKGLRGVFLVLADDAAFVRKLEQGDFLVSLLARVMEEKLKDLSGVPLSAPWNEKKRALIDLIKFSGSTTVNVEKDVERMAEAFKDGFEQAAKHKKSRNRTRLLVGVLAAEVATAALSSAAGAIAGRQGTSAPEKARAAENSPAKDVKEEKKLTVPSLPDLAPAAVDAVPTNNVDTAAVAKKMEALQEGIAKQKAEIAKNKAKANEEISQKMDGRRAPTTVSGKPEIPPDRKWEFAGNKDAKELNGDGKALDGGKNKEGFGDADKSLSGKARKGGYTPNGGEYGVEGPQSWVARLTGATNLVETVYTVMNTEGRFLPRDYHFVPWNLGSNRGDVRVESVTPEPDEDLPGILKVPPGHVPVTVEFKEGEREDVRIYFDANNREWRIDVSSGKDMILTTRPARPGELPPVPKFEIVDDAGRALGPDDPGVRKWFPPDVLQVLDIMRGRSDKEKENFLHELFEEQGKQIYTMNPFLQSVNDALDAWAGKCDLLARNYLVMRFMLGLPNPGFVVGFAGSGDITAEQAHAFLYRDKGVYDPTQFADPGIKIFKQAGSLGQRNESYRLELEFLKNNAASVREIMKALAGQIVLADGLKVGRIDPGNAMFFQLAAVEKELQKVKKSVSGMSALAFEVYATNALNAVREEVASRNELGVGKAGYFIGITDILLGRLSDREAERLGIWKLRADIMAKVPKAVSGINKGWNNVVEEGSGGLRRDIRTGREVPEKLAKLGNDIRVIGGEVFALNQASDTINTFVEVGGREPNMREYRGLFPDGLKVPSRNIPPGALTGTRQNPESTLAGPLALEFKLAELLKGAELGGVALSPSGQTIVLSLQRGDEVRVLEVRKGGDVATVIKFDKGLHNYTEELHAILPAVFLPGTEKWFVPVRAGDEEGNGMKFFGPAADTLRVKKVGNFMVYAEGQEGTLLSEFVFSGFGRSSDLNNGGTILYSGNPNKPGADQFFVPGKIMDRLMKNSKFQQLIASGQVLDFKYRADGEAEGIFVYLGGVPQVGILLRSDYEINFSAGVVYSPVVRRGVDGKDFVLFQTLSRGAEVAGPGAPDRFRKEMSGEDPWKQVTDIRVAPDGRWVAVVGGAERESLVGPVVKGDGRFEGQSFYYCLLGSHPNGVNIETSSASINGEKNTYSYWTADPAGIIRDQSPHGAKDWWHGKDVSGDRYAELWGQLGQTRNIDTQRLVRDTSWRQALHSYTPESVFIASDFVQFLKNNNAAVADWLADAVGRDMDRDAVVNFLSILQNRVTDSPLDGIAGVKFWDRFFSHPLVQKKSPDSLKKKMFDLLQRVPDGDKLQDKLRGILPVYDNPENLDILYTLYAVPDSSPPCSLEALRSINDIFYLPGKGGRKSADDIRTALDDLHRSFEWGFALDSYSLNMAKDPLKKNFWYDSNASSKLNYILRHFPAGMKIGSGEEKDSLRRWQDLDRKLEEFKDHPFFKAFRDKSADADWWRSYYQETWSTVFSGLSKDGGVLSFALVIAALIGMANYNKQRQRDTLPIEGLRRPLGLGWNKAPNNRDLIAEKVFSFLTLEEDKLLNGLSPQSEFTREDMRGRGFLRHRISGWSMALFPREIDQITKLRQDNGLSHKAKIALFTALAIPTQRPDWKGVSALDRIMKNMPFAYRMSEIWKRDAERRKMIGEILALQEEYSKKDDLGGFLAALSKVLKAYAPEEDGADSSGDSGEENFDASFNKAIEEGLAVAVEEGAFRYRDRLDLEKRRKAGEKDILKTYWDGSAQYEERLDRQFNVMVVNWEDLLGGHDTSRWMSDFVSLARTGKGRTGMILARMPDGSFESILAVKNWAELYPEAAPALAALGTGALSIEDIEKQTGEEYVQALWQQLQPSLKRARNILAGNKGFSAPRFYVDPQIRKAWETRNIVGLHEAITVQKKGAGNLAIAEWVKYLGAPVAYTVGCDGVLREGWVREDILVAYVKDGKLHPAVLDYSKPETGVDGAAPKEGREEKAMLSSSRNEAPRETGGIDLTAERMNIETRGSGEGIRFNVAPAMLEEFRNAPGFEPEILSVEPMKDLPKFLGINSSEPALNAA